MERHEYSRDYYTHGFEGSLSSAKEIVPLVLRLVQPLSVIDVGCGVGAWLSVFKELGIDDILGVDGDYIDRDLLRIPEEQFLVFDLNKPFRLERRFDLVISLEVAEHIPEERAEGFVDSLVKLGPIVLFSAAIPNQGGTYHVNEQWPEYWVKYFQEKGYVVIDALRKKIWQNSNVEPWYAQNLLLFADRSVLENQPALKHEFERTDVSQLSIVHPGIYEKTVVWLFGFRSRRIYVSYFKFLLSIGRWTRKRKRGRADTSVSRTTRLNSDGDAFAA